MKIGLSLILVIAAELLLATAGASARGFGARGFGARGFGGGTVAGNRLAVPSRPPLAAPPGHIVVERRVLAAPAASHRLFIEHPFPARRRIVIVRPLVVVPPVIVQPQIIVVCPLAGCPP